MKITLSVVHPQRGVLHRHEMVGPDVGARAFDEFEHLRADHPDASVVIAGDPSGREAFTREQCTARIMARRAASSPASMLRAVETGRMTFDTEAVA